VNTTELVAYFAEEFERLAAASKPRGMSNAERAELVQWLRQEFRRLARGGDKHGPVIVYHPRNEVVKVEPPPRPHLEHGMGLPECLRTATTAANLSRLGLPATAWVRLPQNAPWAVRVHDDSIVRERA